MAKEICYRKIPAICPDGITRKVNVRCYIYDGSLAANHAFATPANLRFRGVTVRGYVTRLDGLGFTQSANDENPELKFDIPDNSKHWDIFQWKTLSVAIFHVYLSYGGPEEGGWWYTSGYPAEDYLHYLKIFQNPIAARRYRDKLQSGIVEELNKGKRPLSSVLSDGRYSVEIQEGLPKPFPSKRPYYE